MVNTLSMNKNTNITFTQLKLSNWRQFDSIDIQFHDRITILTGTNGTGKSTVLNVLSHHFNWTDRVIQTPSQIDGIANYQINKEKKGASISVGTIFYSNKSNSIVWFSETQYDAEKTITFNQAAEVRGVHIPAHRISSRYLRVVEIPTTPIESYIAFLNYSNSTKVRYLGSHQNREPFYDLSRHLISLAVFGRGNEDIPGNENFLDIFSGFEKLLESLLPIEFGYSRLKIILPDLILATKYGDISIDALSGGLRALVDLAYSIYMLSIGLDSFVVTIDEPEAHLHPEMQKQLLPSLMNAFPKAQFVVATHSPIIATSVKDSSIYSFQFAENGVQSFLIERDKKAQSANEALREILGLDSSFPTWSQEETQSILDEYKGRETTVELLDEIRERLEKAGLASKAPKAISEILRAEAKYDQGH